jgi:hypothetical protein
MFEVLENGQVLKVSEVETPTQKVIIKEHYCMARQLEMSADKLSASADGVDAITVTVKALSYLGEPLNDLEIRFLVEGSEALKRTNADGLSVIMVTSAASGEFNIVAEIPGYDRKELKVVFVGA